MAGDKRHQGRGTDGVEGGRGVGGQRCAVDIADAADDVYRSLDGNTDGSDVAIRRAVIDFECECVVANVTGGRRVCQIRGNSRQRANARTTHDAIRQWKPLWRYSSERDVGRRVEIGGDGLTCRLRPVEWLEPDDSGLPADRRIILELATVGACVQRRFGLCP